MRGMSDVGSNQDVARPPEPSELSGSIHGSFDPDARIGKAAPDGVGVERGDVEKAGDALSEFNPDARIGTPSGDAAASEAEIPASGEPNVHVSEHASGDLRGPDGYYTSLDDRKGLALATRGEWVSSPGNSLCRPDVTTEGGRAVKEELARAGLEGIVYKGCVPDFGPVAKETVTIDTMTPDIETNRAQVYQALADRWCAGGAPTRRETPRPTGSRVTSLNGRRKTTSCSMSAATCTPVSSFRRPFTHTISITVAARSAQQKRG